MSPRSKRSSSGRANQLSGRVRIIAGQWRGRKLPVVELDGLRPSGDRVRETLFNWLQVMLPGRHCLDLFAGTGALGLEAASRGAASVTLVEPDAAAATSLKNTLQVLSATPVVNLANTDAASFLAANERRFDIVFVDPPFDAHMHRDILVALLDGHLGPNGIIYVESDSALDVAQLLDTEPALAQLSVLKQRRFGAVNAVLLEVQSPDVSG